MPADVREWDVFMPPAVIKLRKRETNSGKRSRDLLPDKSSISQRGCGSVAPRPVGGVESWAAPCFGAAGTFITSRCGPSPYPSPWQIQHRQCSRPARLFCENPFDACWVTRRPRTVGSEPHKNDGGGLDQTEEHVCVCECRQSTPATFMGSIKFVIWAITNSSSCILYGSSIDANLKVP